MKQELSNKLVSIGYTNINENNIKDIEIVRRQTNKKDKNDKSFIRVTLVDGGIQSEGELKLTYNYYDKGGWVLDDVSKNLDKNFSYTLIGGINEAQIKESLINQNINIGEWYGSIGFWNRLWSLNKDEISKIDIVEQNTDINQKTDEVIINLRLKNEMLKVSGNLKLIYVFNHDHWKIEKIELINDFDHEFVNDRSMDIEQVKKDIVNHEFSYNVFSKWKINEGQVRDLKVIDQKINDKGKKRLIIAQIKLEYDKKLFVGEFKIIYDYIPIDGWRLSTIKLKSPLEYEIYNL